MRLINMIIFFAAFFLVYGLLNYYIFRHGWQAIPSSEIWRKGYLVLFIFIALSFVLGRTLEHIRISLLSEIMIWIGSFWFAFILYFFLAIVLLDLLRLINHFLPFYPRIITNNYIKAKQVIALSIIFITAAVVLTGYLNAQKIRVRHLTISVDKKINQAGTVRLVVVSDIHLGTIIGRKRFCKIVNLINEQQPMLVLLAGDIIDEDIAPVINKNLGEAIKQIQCPWGIYGITGNHEYIGGAEQACRYLEDHGISMLRDRVVTINHCLTLIGREDRSIKSFTGKNRKKLDELIGQGDRTLPVIMMDHQPFGLEEAERNGVDLQLSGHTHHGQLWPLNLITSQIYELSQGFRQKGKTNYYVSAGAGTWGPPVRIGSVPEIVVIDLKSSGQ